jgi:threonine dehydratase
MKFDVTLADIQAAAARISGRVRRTPTWASAGLSARLGVDTWVKLESLQLGGSFKLRGCFNRMLAMSDRERAAGVVTVSGGNHAIAVALAAQALAMRATVLMPEGSAPYNVALTRAAGAEVQFEPDAAACFRRAEELAGRGMTAVHPYDDRAIIAGHGTLGLELITDAGGRVDHVFLSIGGGGFAAGVGAALKGLDPAVRIHGVETEGATAMSEALAAGRPVAIEPRSIARTLAAPFVTERTLAAARQFLEEVVVVPDAAAVREIDWVLQHGRVLLEPAASAVIAAAEARKESFGPDDRVLLVLCGSNVALEEIAAWRHRFAV